MTDTIETDAASKERTRRGGRSRRPARSPTALAAAAAASNASSTLRQLAAPQRAQSVRTRCACLSDDQVEAIHESLAPHPVGARHRDHERSRAGASRRSGGGGRPEHEHRAPRSGSRPRADRDRAEELRADAPRPGAHGAHRRRRDGVHARRRPAQRARRHPGAPLGFHERLQGAREARAGLQRHPHDRQPTGRADGAVRQHAPPRHLPRQPLADVEVVPLHRHRCRSGDRRRGDDGAEPWHHRRGDGRLARRHDHHLRQQPAPLRRRHGRRARRHERARAGGLHHALHADGRDEPGDARGRARAAERRGPVRRGPVADRAIRARP